MTRTITLSWDASAGPDVAGYRVHYGMRTGAYTHHLDAGPKTAAQIPNLIEGTTYYFVVTAYDSHGLESEPSEEIHYMPNPALLLNISARAVVQTGEKVLISGFIIGGMGETRILIRALGPSLAAGGLTDTLQDPTLEIHGPGGVLATNDNWQQADASAIEALHMAPASPAEAAVLVQLRAGSYTAVVRGAAGGTGVALLEVYDCGNVETEGARAQQDSNLRPTD